MIARGASSSPCSASVAMRGGTPAFDLRHKTASTRAGDTGCCDQTHGNRHQDCAFLRAILRGGRIANALHQPRKDDPGHSFRLQSP